MDPRRASSRTVIDPKVRQVGFFTPGAPPDPTLTPTSTTLTATSSPLVSPSGNSIMSPVMIPPPTHFSDSNNKCSVGGVECIAVGSSYNPSSPATEFSGSGGECLEKVVASSLPVGGFEMPQKQLKGNAGVGASSLTTVSMLSGSSNLLEKGGLSIGAQNESSAGLKSSKEKSSKAERRAAQEADRAAKGAAKSLKGTSSKAERRAIQEAERAAKAAAKGA